MENITCLGTLCIRQCMPCRCLLFFDGCWTSRSRAGSLFCSSPPPAHELETIMHIGADPHPPPSNWIGTLLHVLTFGLFAFTLTVIVCRVLANAPMVCAFPWSLHICDAGHLLRPFVQDTQHPSLRLRLPIHARTSTQLMP